MYVTIERFLYMKQRTSLSKKKVTKILTNLVASKRYKLETTNDPDTLHLHKYYN